MNRASLLHILDHATALGAEEVRELEQLAQAFPYCQTAHLLLAKAAHDQGTMLASQRLRRAATYAADRALLRQLIETVPEAQDLASEAVEVPVAVPEPAVTFERFRPAALPVVEAEAQALPAVPVVAEPATGTATEAPLFIPAPAGVSAEVPLLLDATAEPRPATPLSEVVSVNQPAPAAPVVAPEPAESALAPRPAIGQDPEVTATLGAVAAPMPQEIVEPTDIQPSPESIAAATPAPSETVALAAGTLATAEAVASSEAEPQTDPQPSTPAAEIAVLDVAATPDVVPADEPLLEGSVSTPLADALPAAAPPVRPPAEEGTARFEFGLSEEALPAPAYLLPGLSDEWTWPLPEKPVPAPALTPAAFTGDAEIGYGWGEGSRLGWALRPLLPDAGAAIAEGAAAPLPPTGEFFVPDALLLAHWATHGPAGQPAPSALDLIDNFLRQKPRLSRPTLHKATTEALADLSTPSTRPEPEMASETLARILARQGKTGRAIEIYERLMVKQPEKMAYFAAEIQQLQLQQPPLP